VARVVVDVMLKPEILDPQGQAVANALPSLGIDGVSAVRIGKRIEIEFDDGVDADDRARLIADKLLANPVIEEFRVHRVDDLESADR
jgi:phosphoribosylformylglycinamidine synthase PurS subunit